MRYSRLTSRNTGLSDRLGTVCARRRRSRDVWSSMGVAPSLVARCLLVSTVCPRFVHSLRRSSEAKRGRNALTGLWLSGTVCKQVGTAGGQEVAGSNPVAPNRNWLHIKNLRSFRTLDSGLRLWSQIGRDVEYSSCKPCRLQGFRSLLVLTRNQALATADHWRRPVVLVKKSACPAARDAERSSLGMRARSATRQRVLRDWRSPRVDARAVYRVSLQLGRQITNQGAAKTMLSAPASGECRQRPDAGP